LTVDDFQRCFKEIHISLNMKELNDILKLIDSNQNTIIEYQEFLRATCDRDSLLSKENLKNTFMILIEGSEKNYIDANDIKKFIFHDIDIQDDIFTEYLDQFGMKKDDKINFEQFCSMLKNNKKLHESEFDEQNKEEESKPKDSSDNNNGKKLLKRFEFKGIQIIELKEEEYGSEK